MVIQPREINRHFTKSLSILRQALLAWETAFRRKAIVLKWVLGSRSMQNYTASGFKDKAPESIFKLIKEFWDKNKDSDKPGAMGSR
jgi:hypothetical protein